MRSMLCSLLLLITLYPCNVGLADQVHFQKRHLVHNGFRPGRCLLCCFEALGKRHGIVELQRFTKRRDNSIAWGRISHVLSNTLSKEWTHKVFVYTNDLAPIYAAIETGWGCIVGVNDGKHAILVVDIKKGTDKEGGFVEILDPSDSTLSVQQIPKSEFLRIWSGQIVTVWRKE